MTRTEKRNVRRILLGVIAACGEVMEELARKRAANWGIVNRGLVDAERMAADLRDKSAAPLRSLVPPKRAMHTTRVRS